MQIGSEVYNKIFEDILKKYRYCFARIDGFKTMKRAVKGYHSSAAHKNSWQMSEATDHPNPYPFQNLLNRGSMNVSKMIKILEEQSVLSLGEAGILIFDETGFLKKGDKSAGVGRQYSGTAGRVENSQVGVFAAWKTEKGHTLIDCRLYIQEDWFKDRERCRAANIPEDREFQTKNELMKEMYDQFRINTNKKPRWVVADEAYGRDQKIRHHLESNEQPYVLAVGNDHKVRVGLRTQTVKQWLAEGIHSEWKILSCGKGSKGERFYNWSIYTISGQCSKGFVKKILMRQSLSDPTDIAYYQVFGPESTTLQEFVTVAGSRWAIEECFETGKGETGLDQYEVRMYQAWYRHMALSMIAMLILVASRIFINSHESSKSNATLDLEPSAMVPSLLTSEQKSDFAQGDKTIPVPEGNAFPMPEDKVIPSREDKAIPAPEEKAIPVPEHKVIPSREDKAIPAPEDKAISAPEDKAIPAPEDKTIPMKKETSNSDLNEKSQLIKAKTPSVSMDIFKKKRNLKIKK